MKKLLYITVLAALLLPALEAGESSPPADTPVLDTSSDTISLSPSALLAIITGIGAAGGGYMYGRKHKVEVEPQPLQVRNADTHYVTREEHDTDMKRLYDLYYDTSNKLSELIGLVQGIRDAMSSTRP